MLRAGGILDQPAGLMAVLRKIDFRVKLEEKLADFEERVQTGDDFAEIMRQSEKRKRDWWEVE